MRLTLINQFYPPDLSPTAHLCASLAEHRAAQGDQVTVLAGRGGYLGRIEEDHSTAGVHVQRIWTAQLGSRGKIRRLIDWLTFYALAMIRAALLPRQDVIVVLTTPPLIGWAGLLQKLLRPRTRLVLWNMDCWPDIAERLKMIRAGGIVSRLMRAMNRILFRRLDHLICLDSAMAKLLLGQYSNPDRSLPCTIIPNWERASLFASEQTAPCLSPAIEALRDRFVVLYLGNAGFGHEFAAVLDAARMLREEGVVFLFVGGGSQWQWIARQARRRGLDNLVMHEYVPKEQTPDVMRIAGCALITLDDCALGVMSPSKMHSNLAMGLPIVYVGPAGSNVDEAIERFGCGASVRPDAPGKMVEFIRCLVRDRGRHAEFRRRARYAFDQAYCDARTLPQFDEVFAGLTVPSSGPDAGEQSALCHIGQ